MVTDDELTKEQRLAIQLSHNSIAGEDDPAVLLQLFNEIEDVDLKQYSGIDDVQLEQLLAAQPASIAEVNLEFRNVVFAFLPHEAEQLDAIFQQALAMASANKVMLADFPEFDRLVAALEKVESAVEVQNRATQMRLVLDVFEAHADEFFKARAERSK